MSADPPTTATAASIQVLVSSIAVRGLGFVRMIGAARLLLPEEFGRFAVVAALLGVFEATTQPGIPTALVQTRDVSTRDAQTAWTLLVGRGVVLAAGVAVLAEPLASLFGSADISGLVRLAAGVFLLRGLAGVGVHLAVRQVNFRPQVQSQLAGALVETGVALILAAVTRSAIALVIGLLAGAAAETLVTHVVARFRHRLILDRASARSLTKVSRWLFASTLLEFVATTGDDLLVARMTGPGPLGRYRVAYRVASLPTTEISHVIGRVAIPVLSRTAWEEDAKVESSYVPLVSVVTGLAAATGGVFMALSNDIVDTVLGAEWAGTATPLAILAVAGIVRAVTATAGPLFIGLGVPWHATRMLLARAVSLTVALVLLVPDHGITGAAVASLISVVAMVPPWIGSLRTIGLRPSAVGVAVVRRWPPVAAATIAALAATASIRDPLAGGMLGGIAAIGLWYVAMRRFDSDLYDQLMIRLREIRRGVRR